MNIPRRVISAQQLYQIQAFAFSQECAKASFPDICSIPIQANKARHIIGVSFDLNDTVIKIGRAFNTRRNTRLRDKVARNVLVMRLLIFTCSQNSSRKSKVRSRILAERIQPLTCSRFPIHPKTSLFPLIIARTTGIQYLMPTEQGANIAE